MTRGVDDLLADLVETADAAAVSYLDNTMFARLAATGLVGTSGTATELVHQQVVESFNGNKALVLAALVVSACGHVVSPVLEWPRSPSSSACLPLRA